MLYIYYAKSFIREYKKCTDETKATAKEKEKIFCINPFDNTLQTHKLNGHLLDLWSFRLTYKLRIIFQFRNNNEVIFIHIGNHDIYE